MNSLNGLKNLKRNKMKQFILIFFVFLLLSCEERKEVYETSIKTYVISMKLDPIKGRYGRLPVLYFQNPTSTEACYVDIETYNKYQIGDTIQVLIKYWEKTKKK